MKLQLLFFAALAMCVVVATTASPVPAVCMDTAREANCKDAACLRALEVLPAICQLALKAGAGAPSRRLRARDLLAEGNCGTDSMATGGACYGGFLCQTGYCIFPATGSGLGTCAASCVTDGQRVQDGDTCSCCSATTSQALDNRDYCGTAS